jgi:hemolysin activation/secretion protein
VDVDLVVQDKLPLHASLELNNQYNQKTTPLRFVGTMSYSNLWQLGHTISLTAQTAPLRTSDAKVISGSYMFRLPDTPFTMLFYGLKSDSDVVALSTTDVVGKGTIFGVRAIASVPGTDTFYSSATIGLDRKNLTQDVLTAGVPNSAPVLYYPVSLAYAPVWHDANLLTEANLSLNFALPGLGGASNSFDAQRFDAQRQYIYGKLDLSGTASLPWGGSAFIRVVGQLADGPLLSSEQFSAGGANSVRGYLEAEALGDNAVQYTFEFRSPSIAASLPAAVNDWHFLAFADAAALWLREPLPGQDRTTHIAGVGLGTRFTAFDILNGAVDVAYPLQDAVATKAGTPRVHFRFWMGL